MAPKSRTKLTLASSVWHQPLAQLAAFAILGDNCNLYFSTSSPGQWRVSINTKQLLCSTIESHIQRLPYCSELTYSPHMLFYAGVLLEDEAVPL